MYHQLDYHFNIRVHQLAIGNAFNNEGGTGADPSNNLNIYFEDLTTSVNGERTSFSLSRNYDANTIIVYLNGLRQRQNTIGQTGNNSFTLPEAPIIGDILEVRYSVTST
tara:strand:+ start:508 stop:834 length:327 start_codon:yes stop_codon:yes gene_type:complete